MMAKQQYVSDYKWVIYIGILLAAFTLRIAVFDYGLPYVANTDSPNFYLRTNDIRGKLDAGWRNDLLAGYPPAYIWLYTQTLNIIDLTSDYNVHTDQYLYTANLRLLSVFASVITVATGIGLARYMGGYFAGIIAGLVLALSTEVIFLSAITLPDLATSMFTILCAFVSAVSIRKDSMHLAFLGTILGLTAFLFKYPVAPILLLPAFFFLRDLWKRRFRAVPTAFLALFIVLSTAYYALMINGGAAFDIAETRNFQGNIGGTLLNFTEWRWGASFNLLFDVLGLPILVLAVASVFYQRLWKTKHKLSSNYWVLLAATIPIFVIVPIYLVRLGSVRYVYPAMVLFTVIFAVRQRYLIAWWRWGAVALIIIGGLYETIPFVHQMRQPYTESYLQQWAEENVPDGRTFWTESHFTNRILARYESGYSGYKNFGLFFAPDSNWLEVEQYIDYVVLSDADVASWERDETHPPIESLLPIKYFDSTGINGASLTVYDPHLLENITSIDLANDQTTVRLRGYNLQQSNRDIQLRTYWQAPDNIPPVNYSYVVYLTPIDEPESVAYQQDAGLGNRVTSTWTDSQELIRGNITPFSIPQDVDAGTYEVRLSIYYWETGERLQMPSDVDYIIIDEIVIE